MRLLHADDTRIVCWGRDGRIDVAVRSVFMCFVWISEQTAIISLYNINWLGFYIWDRVCLLRGTMWIVKYFKLISGDKELK
jgi:hypothetical protein